MNTPEEDDKEYEEWEPPIEHGARGLENVVAGGVLLVTALWFGYAVWEALA